MRRFDTRVVTEIGLAVALAAVLNLPFLRVRLPFNVAGGTIALNMLPLFVVALRRGLIPGLIAGALYGVIDAILDPFIVHPVQFVLDYPIAYGLTGLAGVASSYVKRVKITGGAHAAALVGALTLGVAGRFAAHWLSGVIYFGSYAPEGQPVWLYSLVYQSTYLLPSLALTAVAALAILPVLERAVPADPRRPTALVAGPGESGS
ncbi:energy-coupled thiamine transporter ThiT [bacterium]|nr:energy-coupled thiamine transporter ThiT [bacterium]